MTKKKQAGPRVLAAQAVHRVVVGRKSLNEVMPGILERAVPRDRPLVQELSYGSLRWLPRLSALIAVLLNKPFKARDQDVTAVLQVALYELLYTQGAEHAAVDEAVKSTRALGKPWAAPVINASLRRFLRERARLVASLDTDPMGRLAFPGWLLQRFQEDWPGDWEAIVAASNQRPPMWLRVNASRIGRDEYARLLGEAGMESTPSEWSAVALRLARPVNVNELPGFGDGLVSVQDVSAQLAAGLMDTGAGSRVLDVCAAPGGKTAHLLESGAVSRGAPEVVAVDVDADRARRIRENVERLGLDPAVRVVVGDALKPSAWWDEKPFDRILVDAPCSATGVIRRHPDIKLLREPEDIAELAGRQREILEAVWPLLAPGGMLVYATCSVLREENEEVVAAFVAAGAGREVARVDARWGRPGEFGRQILPGEGDGDGFYYASLHKSSS